MFLLPFSAITNEDQNLVGYKAIGLANLSQNGLSIPSGFVITTAAYQAFIKANQLELKLAQELANFNPQIPESAQHVASSIQAAIINAQFDKNLATQIFDSFEALGSAYVALRSSSTSNKQSFGQNPLYLNVSGESTIIEFIKQMWAQHFEAQNLHSLTRVDQTDLAIIIQTMINSHCAGLLHTSDPKNQKKHTIHIEAIWGLGEILVEELVTPDYYEVSQSTLDLTHKETHPQANQLIRSGSKTVEQAVPKHLREKQKLSFEQIKQLATLGKKVRSLYFYPQTIEWVFDGAKFWLVDTQDLLTGKKHKTKRSLKNPETSPTFTLPLLDKGEGLFPGLAIGHANSQNESSFDKNTILILDDFEPDILKSLSQVIGIIITKNRLEPDILNLIQELSLPTIWLKNKLKIKANQLLTINGTTGEIYQGKLELRSKIIPTPKTDVNHPSKTATKLFISSPFGLSQTNNYDLADGISNIRGELLLSQLKYHPKKLIADDKADHLSNHIAKALAELVKNQDKPFFYHLSNWNSLLQRDLYDGKSYQPKEPNPLLGLRGTWYLLNNPSLLKAELKGLDKTAKAEHFQLVLPFVSSAFELGKLLKFLEDNSFSTKHVWLNLETPANLIDLPQLASPQIEGFIIDLPALSILVLGLDSQNMDLSQLLSQFDPSVLWLTQHCLNYAHKYHKPVLVHANKLSLYPQIIELLVKAGVWGLSIPETELATIKKTIARIETYQL
ncbi:hypothetical protein GYA49_03080 [Candidatus Beckwithbacteria bacterium]|nr:hypothetical protein [Candidatus Beckwithbacteria bacterium]